MPLTDTFGRMPLDRIWVHRAARQRRELDLERGGFLASVALRGVIMPVILEEVPDEHGYHVLYAGERRYAASLTLGLADIPYRFARSPDETEIQIIELEENIKRSDLTWQETLQAVVRVHALFVEATPGWTYEQTGEHLGWSGGSFVAKYHFVAASWGEAAIRACGTMNEAYNLLQRRQKRAQASKLEDWLGAADAADDERTPDDVNGDSASSDSDGDGAGGDGAGGDGVDTGADHATDAAVARRILPPPAAAAAAAQLPVTEGDFLEWAPSYAGPRFNLIHCDFPYGVNFEGGGKVFRSGANHLHREEGEKYDDQAEVNERLLDCLVTNFDRIAAESCHLMFWYSNRWDVEVATRAALGRVPGLSLLRFPLMWLKSDNAGFITPGHPRHIYETCLVGVRADRPIVKYVSDAYSAPSDNSLHMSAKPEPMLRYFMGMFVDEHTRLLDPTCGAASALRAAEALRAQVVCGVESNPEMVRVANTALLQARAARRAAEAASQ